MLFYQLLVWTTSFRKINIEHLKETYIMTCAVIFKPLLKMLLNSV